MQFSKHIKNDILKAQNLDVYITILLSVIIAILGVFGIVNSSIISSATLATLALLSISMLHNRQENKRFQKTIEELKISHASNQMPFISEYEYDRLELKRKIEAARQSFFWGFSWTTTIPILGDSILAGVNNGLEVRFLLIEPSSPSAKMATFGGNTTSESDFDLSLKASLLRLARLQESVPSGKIDVKTVNFFPPYRIIAIDPNLPTGFMIVRLTSLRDYRSKAPVIEISKADNQEWFDFFVQQFEHAWIRSEKLTEDQYKF